MIGGIAAVVLDCCWQWDRVLFLICAVQICMFRLLEVVLLVLVGMIALFVVVIVALDMLLCLCLLSVVMKCSLLPVHCFLFNIPYW